MRIKPNKKKLFLSSLLLGITIPLALVACQNANNNKKEPFITPHYLLSGTRLEGEPESIFDFYDIGNNELALSLKEEIKTTYNQAIEIPATYGGKNVTGVWHNAFHNCPATSITFASPSNISVIDFEAFFF